MTISRAETLGILADFIGFDTVSARSSLEMIEHVADYPRVHDVRAMFIVPSKRM